MNAATKGMLLGGVGGGASMGALGYYTPHAGDQGMTKKDRKQAKIVRGIANGVIGAGAFGWAGHHVGRAQQITRDLRAAEIARRAAIVPAGLPPPTPLAPSASSTILPPNPRALNPDYVGDDPIARRFANVEIDPPPKTKHAMWTGFFDELMQLAERA